MGKRKFKLFPKGVCPTCQQTIEDMPLKVDLQNNVIIYRDIAVHMTNNDISIVSVLADAFPNIVPFEILYTRAFGSFAEHKDPEKLIHVVVCTANKILMPIGIKIENSIATGWRLTYLPPHETIIQSVATMNRNAI